MNAWWQQPITDVAKNLSTDLQNGLSEQEAKNRLETYGPNQLPEQKRISPIELFLNQFSNFIVWILIGALAISAILGEIVDVLAIGAIILLNALIGFVQEYRAESSLAALQRLARPMAKVVRDGVLRVIQSYELVPGDLVLIEHGDTIPADGRVVVATQLATQEAALTGESVPIVKITDSLSEKELMIGDRVNMVFMGTSVVSGKGSILVTQTGLDTELGNIATTLQAVPEGKTHLDKQLDKVSFWLVGGCFTIVVTIFLLGLLWGSDPILMILTALSLAVAAIPEGLPTVITVALAIGVKRMVKRNALMRRLSSVETLGSVTVICTDKTGTLTQNEMVVKALWVNNKFFAVKGIGYVPEGTFEYNQHVIDPHANKELLLALKIGVLCNSAQLLRKDQLQKNGSTNDSGTKSAEEDGLEKDGVWEIIGDPTEGALLVAAGKAGLEKVSLEKEFPLLKEFPFDSERKRMSMLREHKGRRILFVKGAPDIVLQLSTTLELYGEIVPLTDEIKKQILEANNSLAGQALRVLACAYRQDSLIQDSLVEVTSYEISDESQDLLVQNPLAQDLLIQDSMAQGSLTLEKDLVFVGLIAMIDPPRLEVKDALEKCKRAGIRTVMITGDHKETAIAIADELGLLSTNAIAIDGRELDSMDANMLAHRVDTISVYSRVTAAHKMRIIKAWKARGEIVAMTGDGVNDAPALKAADIGIAMGITGTDVAKEASDMIILDDNFASIVSAVEEGRGIYESILKFVNYLLSSNIAELLVIFMSILFQFAGPKGMPMVALLPVQILWLNFITDGLPAIALVFDPIDPKVMDRPPRKPSKPIISQIFALELFSMAWILALGALVACYFGFKTSVELGQTMALTTLIILSFVRVHMVRARSQIGFFSNIWLIIALAGSLILQLLIIYVPQLRIIFRTVALDMYAWIIIVMITAVVWLVGTFVQRQFQKKLAQT